MVRPNWASLLARMSNFMHFCIMLPNLATTLANNGDKNLLPACSHMLKHLLAISAAPRIVASVATMVANKFNSVRYVVGEICS